MPIIEVQNLVKEYTRKKNKISIKNFIYPEHQVLRAVDDISFSVKKGEIVGYIGTNGSGKSTTIKMLSGILVPTSGSIKVNGLIPHENRIANNKQIGVVFGNRSQLFWDVPVIESFKLLQKIYEIPIQDFKQNMDQFVNILGLKEILDVPERQLSLGQRTRCNITAAFLHNPNIVYLDEPTIGLDIESKEQIRKFIQQINREKGTTFLITSHDFQDIEMLCEKIIVLDKGKIIENCKIEEMRRAYNKHKVIKCEVKNNEFYYKSMFSLSGVEIRDIKQSYIELEYDTNKINEIQIINYINEKCDIKDLEVQGRSLESMIKEIINSGEKK